MVTVECVGLSVLETQSGRAIHTGARGLGAVPGSLCVCAYVCALVGAGIILRGLLPFFL